MDLNKIKIFFLFLFLINQKNLRAVIPISSGAYLSQNKSLKSSLNNFLARSGFNLSNQTLQIDNIELLNDSLTAYYRQLYTNILNPNLIIDQSEILKILYKLNNYKWLRGKPHTFEGEIFRILLFHPIGKNIIKKILYRKLSSSHTDEQCQIPLYEQLLEDTENSSHIDNRSKASFILKKLWLTEEKKLQKINIQSLYPYLIKIKKRLYFFEDLISATQNNSSHLGEILKDIKGVKYKGNNNFLKKSYHLANINRFIREKKCQKSRKHLKNYLILKPSLKKSIIAIKLITKCRSHHHKKRIEILKSTRQILTENFKLEGWSEVSLKIVKEYWNTNKYKKALSLVNEIEIKSKEKNRKIYLKSLFLKGNILKDNKNIEESFKSYFKIFQIYGSKKESLPSLKELTLLSVAMGNWDQVLYFTKSILNICPKEILCSQNNSNIQFSKFWTGRALLELGNKNLAIKTWKSLSSSYFSSYYGSIAHYLVREISKNKINIHYHDNKFKKNDNLWKFLKTDKKRDVLKIKVLMSLANTSGLKCELKKNSEEKNTEKEKYALSIIYALNGELLKSIKIYSQLSYDFRKNIPIESERILFPKKYEKKVVFYGKQASLDPDLILSIIRQESGFNLKALSPAGAQGLMQLMPPTANYILKKVPTHLKKNLQPRRGKSIRKLLFNEDLNIMLGTFYLHKLLNRYDQNVIKSLLAYNAGPTITNRWTKKYNMNDLIYFIENIPYRESKKYVKLIMRNYFYYKLWYNKSINKLPYLNWLHPIAFTNKRKKNKHSG